MTGLTETLSALQAFGHRLGLAGPASGAFDRKRANATFPETAVDGIGVREADGEPEAPAESGSAASASVAGPPTTVYGFRADLKPVKAPDEVLGRLLNTLV
jgi:hypothetical protein